MRTSHKIIGNQIGEAYRRVEEYEQAIEALTDEDLIENMVIERLNKLNGSPYYNDAFFRAISIGVLLEDLRRAKLRLVPEANEWGTTIDEF